MAEIAFEGVVKRYPDGTDAVRGVDLAIEDGEFFVLVGPSGCGKSTLLLMVAGLEELSEGTIRIGGRVVNDLPPGRRDVAMVFQSYALYPHLTVEENLEFGLKLRKVPKERRRARVREVAGVLGIEDLLKRKPRHLSGGQRQRVAMGRAIVREPQAFLMDEPLSNLDAKLRVQMRTEIARIQADVGVTTIYVTHDQVEAMTLGDRVAVMRRGVLQQVASPDDLYRSPANLFVAQFIGSPAMNLVRARIVAEDGALHAVFGSHRLQLPDGTDRSALGARVGREVVLGIRPEAFEDAGLVPDAPAGRRLQSVVEVRESTGADVFVHFAVDAPRLMTEETIEALEDAAEVAPSPEAHEDEPEPARFVARIAAASTAREREPIELVVDTARLYFFDPSTGAALPRAASRKVLV